MSNSIVKSFASLLALALFLTSCEKKEEITGFGEVVLYMDNRAGDEELVMGSPYKNANGDTLQFSLFNYFVSNFVLVKADGSEYVVPKDSCYFLCKHENEGSRKLVLKNVPAGDYTRVDFTIGVDSLKSVAPAGERTGILDPTSGAAGMYWSWNAGYIFVKVEGTSPQAPINSGTGARTFQYHTGLFGGKDAPTLNNLKRVSISTTTESARVREGVEAPEFHLYVDILEQFSSPTNINVATNPTSHAGPYSANVANNYADMFRLDHVHNHD